MSTQEDSEIRSEDCSISLVVGSTAASIEFPSGYQGSGGGFQEPRNLSKQT